MLQFIAYLRSPEPSPTRIPHRQSCGPSSNAGQMCAGTLNEKSDVYAFGVVLLEMLTAAEVVDTKRPAACQNVVDWLYSKLHDVAAIREVCFRV